MESVDAGPAAKSAADVARQYLTFALAKEDYGIEILKVQEIRGRTAITAIPHTPAHVRGVMNLRGTVVPVIDLRLRFGLPTTEYDRFSVIVVVKVAARVVGLVVDSVSDVLDVYPKDVEPPPELGAKEATSFMTGMARAGERLVVLLDIDRLVGTDVNAAGAST